MCLAYAPFIYMGIQPTYEELKQLEKEILTLQEDVSSLPMRN